jgi:hypothetical protein
LVDAGDARADDLQRRHDHAQGCGKNSLAKPARHPVRRRYGPIDEALFDDAPCRANQRSHVRTSPDYRRSAASQDSQLVVFAGVLTGSFTGALGRKIGFGVRFSLGDATFSFGGFEGFRVSVGVVTFIVDDVVFIVVFGDVVGVVGLLVVVFTQAPSALGCVPGRQDLQVPGLAPGTWLWPGEQIDRRGGANGVPAGAVGLGPAGVLTGAGMQPPLGSGSWPGRQPPVGGVRIGPQLPSGSCI